VQDLHQQHTIETPEQVHLSFPIAGIGSRFMAFAIDTLIQTLGFISLSLLLAFLSPSLAKYVPDIGENWLLAIAIIAFFLLYWGYFAFFEAVWNGQTPGKRNVGIRVVKDSGRAINTYEAISRNFLRSIDQLPGMYVFGLISMAVSRENRRIGDYVAGTLVVHESAAEELNPELQDLGEKQSTLTVSTSALDVKDLQLIETFLHRRLSYEADVRHATAVRIAQHIEQKSAQPRTPGQSDEDYLQVMAKAIRDNTR
jgi:uncharacterized RDD family membrane protein YckC